MLLILYVINAAQAHLFKLKQACIVKGWAGKTIATCIQNYKMLTLLLAHAEDDFLVVRLFFVGPGA